MVRTDLPSRCATLRAGSSEVTGGCLEGSRLAGRTSVSEGDGIGGAPRDRGYLVAKPRPGWWFASRYLANFLGDRPFVRFAGCARLAWDQAGPEACAVCHRR